MKLKVAFLNCRSHGDCAVVTFTDRNRKACIVVDGGDNAASAGALAEYLDEQNVRRIDLMVGTHIDSDHINGLKLFVKEQVRKKERDQPFVDVKRFWGPEPSRTRVRTLRPAGGNNESSVQAAQIVIRSVQQNDDLFDALRDLGTEVSHPALDNPPTNPFESVSLDFLGPDRQIPADTITRSALGLGGGAGIGLPVTDLASLEAALGAVTAEAAAAADRNANNQSIVFRLAPRVGSATAKQWKFLFTGDAEEEAWNRMVANPAVASRLRARVLKVPHHGSDINGIHRAGAEAVRPEYSVISVGQKHGLPDEGTMNLLQGLNSEIFCTQRNGSRTKKSACYSVSGSVCPARGNPQTITFELNTTTGRYAIGPTERSCLRSW